MTQKFLLYSAILGLTGVAMGAFGAHGLKAVLSSEMLAVYRTGVDYQMWHALGLGIIALVQQQAPESKHLTWAGYAMFYGVIIFSGSLYLLSILNIKWLGMITPIGGIFLLVSWLMLAIYSVNASKQ